MLFKISKTSTRDYKQPHPKAVFKSIPNWQERWCTEEYYNNTQGRSEGEWRSVGTNHTTGNGGRSIIRKNGTRKEWVIAFADLSELMNFVDEVGQCIINAKTTTTLASIEIYDDYRE